MTIPSKKLLVPARHLPPPFVRPSATAPAQPPAAVVAARRTGGPTVGGRSQAGAPASPSPFDFLRRTFPQSFPAPSTATAPAASSSRSSEGSP